MVANESWINNPYHPGISYYCIATCGNLRQGASLTFIQFYWMSSSEPASSLATALLAVPPSLKEGWTQPWIYTVAERPRLDRWQHQDCRTNPQKTRMLCPVTPRDWREFSRHSIWFDYPPPVRAKPHVKPSSSVAPSSVVPPKPSVAPNLKQPSMDDSQVEYHCCIGMQVVSFSTLDFLSFLPSTQPTASTPKMEKTSSHDLIQKV